LVSQSDVIRREAFGSRLLDAKHGDVIFRFPDTVQAGHEEKMLFASSDLLCRFSPWFKQCTLPPPLSSCSFALICFCLISRSVADISVAWRI
jgi:hypothetical protein